MARKHYQSIIRLLEHSGVDVNAPINLSRLKKQLGAEFDFSSTGFIELEGHSYNKADVFEELDHPLFDQRFAYHLRIWKCKFILGLLEDYSFNYTAFKDQMESFNNDPAFDEFFSPYFTDSFIYLSNNFLTEYKFQEIGQLLLFEEFILAADREEAFRPLRIFMEDNMRVFRNLNKENYNSFRSQLYLWTLPYWSRLFNHLPDEYFEYKNSFAFHLVNLTVSIQRSHPTECVAISQELTCMKDLSEEMNKIILSNHSIYTQKGEGSSISWGWIVWGVLILARIATGC